MIEPRIASNKFPTLDRSGSKHHGVRKQPSQSSIARIFLHGFLDASSLKLSFFNKPADFAEVCIADSAGFPASSLSY